LLNPDNPHKADLYGYKGEGALQVSIKWIVHLLYWIENERTFRKSYFKALKENIKRTEEIDRLTTELTTLKDECTCEECSENLEDPETGVTAFCISCWNAMVGKLQEELKAKDADIERLRQLLKDALPHIECKNASQSGLITEIGQVLEGKTMDDGCRTKDETPEAPKPEIIKGLRLKAEDSNGNEVTEPFKVKFIGPLAFGVVNEGITDKNFVELYVPPPVGGYQAFSGTAKLVKKPAAIEENSEADVKP